MALRRFHFLNPMIHSQSHTLKGWPGHIKTGLATRPSIAKWQFQNSFLFFLGVWVKVVALVYMPVSVERLSQVRKSPSSKTMMLSREGFVFLCTAEKLQSCHVLAHWTQHISAFSIFHSTFNSSNRSKNKDAVRKKLCLSLRSWQTAVLAHWTQHTQPYPAFIHSETLMSTYASAKIIKNQLCRKQGRCSKKIVSFSAQLRNCNLATCWHIELSISQPSPPFIQHLIRTIGRKTRMLYGKSFVSLILCAADKLQCWHIELSTLSLIQLSFTARHWCLLMPLQKSSKITFVENKDAVLRRLCLSLHSWETAILPRVGTLNSAYLSLLHLSCNISFEQLVKKQACCTAKALSFSFSAQLTNCSVGTLNSAHSALSSFHSQRDTDVYLCLCKNHQKSALSKTRTLSEKSCVFLCTAEKLQSCHVLAHWT